MPRSREILLPWDRQPQEAVHARRDRGVIVAHLPGVSGYDAGSGLVPTFGGTAPSNDFRRVIADGMAVEIHPSGGSNGAATIAWPAETISNSDNDLLVIWRGAPKNLSTANGYAFVRGADSNDGGWSIYASFTSATTLVFGVVTTSPGTAGYTATVTDSFTAGELETIAWRLTGGILTGFHQRSGKSSSVSVGQNLRGSSASVLRLGGSTGAEDGGHNISAGLFVVRGSVPDSGVWDAMRNPYECAFEPQTIWVPVSAGAPSGISTTLTQTLADATVSAASTLALKGTTTQTLADATLAATGSLQVAGSGVLAATLADASTSATGTIALKATATQTLVAATVSATSTVAVAGTLAKTLADATLSAQGTAQAVTTGSVAATLDNATVAAAAKLAISAYSAPTLADAALVATATMPLAGISAAMSVALGDATLASSATVLIKGSATISLGDCTIVAAGQDPATVTPTFTVISRRRIGGTPALNPGTRLGGATARSSSVRIGDKKP